MSENKEIWKPVVGYEGHYEVSSKGQARGLEREIVNVNGVKKNRRGRLLNRFLEKSGYFSVIISLNAVRKTRHIHQLVAESFLNHTPCGMTLVVDHIDNNKQNNYANNLRIVTQRENSVRDRTHYSSKHVGVSWCKKLNRWTSKLSIKDKKIYLGSYAYELDAAKAYQDKLRTL